MTFKSYVLPLSLRISVLLGTLMILAFGIVQVKYYLIILGSTCSLIAVYYLYSYVKKRFLEVSDYFESIKYRDFSRWFVESKGPKDMRELHAGFNLINKTIKSINSERQAQLVYLQKILEMVDVGIVAYDLEKGNVLWINDSLLETLNFPHFKNIDFVEDRRPELFEVLFDQRHTGASPVNLPLSQDSQKVLILETIFEVEQSSFRLVVVQNIENTLNKNEDDSWKKLLSVMTHEIMNSIAPITSLAETLELGLRENFENSGGGKLQTEDILSGVSSIKKRSEGLMKFAKTYRSLNNVNQINTSVIYVEEFMDSVQGLMMTTIPEKVEISFNILDRKMQLDIDSYLIEQVLINLIINAVEATEGMVRRVVEIKTFKNMRGRPVIAVIDNGPGISDEIKENIFVPFFSTKKRGSGVGLSLSKQIMTLHKGRIRLFSKESGGTQAELIFNE
ncbi:ATP-binding protein [Nonlabens spongiae]|uniref:histidine kinase n=1 Tax=Nonlabens spongiae TaxID=331648 RepID=A0A1W6MNI5_9FLAO|nr:HAMP domain-containing sensor histidine kinase [Nonlabens spongiae]ARN79164.1 ATP-binding protein [Nonlabens spongiae]